MKTYFIPAVLAVAGLHAAEVQNTLPETAAAEQQQAAPSTEDLQAVLDAAEAGQPIGKAMAAAGLTARSAAADGTTLLMLACEQRRAQLVMPLLLAGANANATDAAGGSVLTHALQQPKSEKYTTKQDIKSCVKTLVAGGARTDAALHTELLLRHDVDSVLGLMLNMKQLRVNDTDAEGRTLLMRAIEADAEESLALLLHYDEADFSLRDKQGRTLLHYVAASYRTALVLWQDPKTAEQLLGKAEEWVNARDSQGRTPLLVLAETMEPEDGICQQHMAEQLIQRGADVNAADAAGRTPLSVAEARGLTKLHRYMQAQLDPQQPQWNACAACLRKGDAEGLRKLLDAGANAAATDARGCTLLQYLLAGEVHADFGFVLSCRRRNMSLDRVLASYGQQRQPLPPERLLACMDVLLAAGADVNAGTDELPPPLLLSVGCKDTAVMHRLLEAGADANGGMQPDSLDEAPLTPLRFIGCAQGCSLPQWAEMLEMLLAAGADVNGNGAKPQYSPLAMVAIYAHADEEEETSLLMMKIMLAQHPRQETLNAAMVRCRDNTAVMQCLLEAGADINARDENGNTLLHHLADYSESTAALQWALAHGADVNARNRSGSTPWLRAVFGTPSVKTLRLLVQAGADVWARDEGGDSAWGKAQEKERTEKPLPEWVPYVKQVTAEARVKAGLPAEVTPAEMVENGEVEALRWQLSDGGTDVNAGDAQGRTLLMAAVSYGGSEVLKEDTVPCEHCGSIHGSERSGRRAAMVRLLLAAGAEVGVTDAEGRTAADWAVAAGEQADSPVLQLLRADAARTDAAVNARLTECMVCITKGDTEGLKQKLQGVDVNAPNRIGLHLFEFACGMAVPKEYSPGLLADGVPALTSFVKANEYLFDDSKNKERCRKGVEALQVLLAAGADPNITDADGDPAVTDFLWEGDAPTVAMLLKAGLNPHATRSNGTTLMTTACSNPPVLKLLLAQSPTQQELNEILVQLASPSVYNEALPELVLAAGAELNAAANIAGGKRYTPLTAAAEEMNEKCLAFLLAKGADPAVPNSEGKTAADILRGKIDELRREIADSPDNDYEQSELKQAQRMLHLLGEE